MISFFSNIFGYALNFIYSLVNNYGIAIILFSFLLKLLLLPLSIKQQKTVKKSEKVQKELKIIQQKHKNNPEKLNQEMMALYKRENMSPFSGCFSAIIQIILLFAMFSLVRNPLTYMLDIDNNKIETVTQYIKKEEGEGYINQTYPQTSIIKYVAQKEKEIEIIKDEEVVEKINLEEMYINMNFLGLDLNEIPQQNYSNIKVFIIPFLYVISSIISIRMTTNKKKKKMETEKVKKEEGDKNERGEEIDMATQMSKNMSLTMPFLSVMVSLLAPLGLALYWLTNNLLMIIERLVLEKFLKDKEEEKENA